MSLKEKYYVFIDYNNETYKMLPFNTIEECRDAVDGLLSDPFFEFESLYSISICDRKGVIQRKCYHK